MCWYVEEGDECPYGAKCHFDHAQERRNKQPGARRQSAAKDADNEWTLVRGQKKNKKKKKQQQQRKKAKASVPAKLKIHSRSNLHPAAWRSRLKKLDPTTFGLVTWVSRESDNWYTIEADNSNAKELLARMGPLRKLGLTVEPCQEQGDEDGEDGEDDRVCADFLSGRDCKHGAPYCK